MKQLRRAAHSTARNAVLIPISQGTEVTIVTEYAPFRYFTRTASSLTLYGNQSNHAVLWCGTTRNQDSGPRGVNHTGLGWLEAAEELVRLGRKYRIAWDDFWASVKRSAKLVQTGCLTKPELRGRELCLPLSSPSSWARGGTLILWDCKLYLNV